MSTQLNQSKTIRLELLDAMRSGEYAHSERLPRESVLAEKLGISRTQLRDILASLEREGFITRRHGVGTIINRHVVDVETRMDIEVEFMDMIRRSGHVPAVAKVSIEERTADQRVAEKLNLPVGTPILCLSRLCTADGKPAIYCEDVIERDAVKHPYTETDLKLPVFDFLRQFCEINAYMDLTDLRPVTADETLANIFQVPVGSPLLNMDELDYDIEGRPIFCSNEYFADGIFHHTVMRKKL